MDRPYRKAFAIDIVLRMMRDERGRCFDPEVLDTFFAQLQEVTRIKEEHVVH